MDRNLFLVLDVVDRLGNLARTGMRRIGATHNLQPVHFQALMFLRQANLYSNTPQALTDYLGLTKGTVSQSLQLLYRKGLIKRYADEKDKRVTKLLFDGSPEAGSVGGHAGRGHGEILGGGLRPRRRAGGWMTIEQTTGLQTTG